MTNTKVQEMKDNTMIKMKEEIQTQIHSHGLSGDDRVTTGEKSAKRNTKNGKEKITTKNQQSYI